MLTSKPTSWRASRSQPSRRVRAGRCGRPSVYTNEELERLFAACDERERVVFETLLLTGLRERELTTLTWEDVCLEPGREHIVVRAKPGFTPKDYEQREVPLPASLAEKLRAWPRTSGLVFPSRRPHPGKLFGHGQEAGMQRCGFKHRLPHPLVPVADPIQRAAGLLAQRLDLLLELFLLLAQAVDLSLCRLSALQAPVGGIDLPAELPNLPVKLLSRVGLLKRLSGFCQQPLQPPDHPRSGGLLHRQAPGNRIPARVCCCVATGWWPTQTYNRFCRN